MPRKVFYSFHYGADCQRAAQVRTMGVVEGNPPASDNAWEKVTRGGNAAIERWIDDQLAGRTCTVVLVGEKTAGRKWIDYEIKESWNRGLGIVGVRIHRLKDLNGDQSEEGDDPFASFELDDGTPMSSVVQLYDPSHRDSKVTYSTIKESLADWIEEAIAIRGEYE